MQRNLGDDRKGEGIEVEKNIWKFMLRVYALTNFLIKLQIDYFYYMEISVCLLRSKINTNEYNRVAYIDLDAYKD